MKHLKLLAACMACLLSLVSCDRDKEDELMIYDFIPVTVRMRIVDANGTSVLDNLTADEIENLQISVDYDGKEYPLHFISEDGYKPFTRAIPAMFFGLYVQSDSEEALFTPSKSQYEAGKDKNVRMAFGEFDGGSSHDIKFKLHLPQYSKDVDFRFVRIFKWNHNTPEITDQLYVDGTLVGDEQSIEIIFKVA